MSRYTDVDFLRNLEKTAFTIMLETGDVKNGSYTQKRSYRLDEEYVITVFNLAADILTSCQYARDTIPYITDFRVTPASKKANITKNSNTIYHLEAHASCLESIYRNILMLVNEVFMLGNQPQYCTDDVILKSNTIGETRVGEMVIKLKKLISDNSASSETLCTLAKIDPTRTFEKLGFRINGTYLRQKKAKMEKVNKQLYAIILDILDELDKEYSKRYPMIKDIYSIVI